MARCMRTARDARRDRRRNPPQPNNKPVESKEKQMEKEFAVLKKVKKYRQKIALDHLLKQQKKANAAKSAEKKNVAVEKGGGKAEPVKNVK